MMDSVHFAYLSVLTISVNIIIFLALIISDFKWHRASYWDSQNIFGQNIWEVLPNTGGGNGSPFQYSCLENPMDMGGAWRATVHGLTNSRTWLSTHTHIFQTDPVVCFQCSGSLLSTFLPDQWVHHGKQDLCPNNHFCSLNTLNCLVTNGVSHFKN